jgi:hypothetical protein
MNLSKANDAKRDKFLDSSITADGEIMTMRAFISRRLAQGYIPIVAQIEDKAQRNKLQKEIDYLRRVKWEPSGNPNWPDTKRYYEIKAQLDGKILCAEYRLQNGDRWNVITKMAYDFARQA